MVASDGAYRATGGIADQVVTARGDRTGAIGQGVIPLGGIAGDDAVRYVDGSPVREQTGRLMTAYTGCECDVIELKETTCFIVVDCRDAVLLIG